MDERNTTLQNFGVQIDFAKILIGVKNYGEILKALRDNIATLKESGITRIGFVSGPIANSSGVGPELRRASIKEKMKQMRIFTHEMRTKHRFPIFSSTDIFDILWEKLEETALSSKERSTKMQELFREVLKSGVTDIFMMEGWREAPGAVDEFKTAKQVGIKIHDSELTSFGGQ